MKKLLGLCAVVLASLQSSSISFAGDAEEFRAELLGFVESALVESFG